MHRRLGLEGFCHFWYLLAIMFIPAGSNASKHLGATRQAQVKTC
jgi:hypothetical protein